MRSLLTAQLFGQRDLEAHVVLLDLDIAEACFPNHLLKFFAGVCTFDQHGLEGQFGQEICLLFGRAR